MKMEEVMAGDPFVFMRLTDYRMGGYWVLYTPNPGGLLYPWVWKSAYRRAATKRDQLPALQAALVYALRLDDDEVTRRVYLCTD